MNPTIELPVNELKDALPGLNKVVSKSSHLPVLQSVRVSRSKAGRITLQTTDLDSCATYLGAETQGGPACELLIPFEPFKNLIKACPPNERLQITRNEKDRVKIRYFIGRNPIEKTYEVPFGDDWPALPSITEPGVPVDDAFKQALREAMDCVSSDTSRLVLQGAYVDVSQRKASYLVAADGRHLYCANSFALDLKQSVIVPGRKFLLWPAFAEDGPWTLALRAGGKKDGAWLQVASPRWTLLTKTIEGDFPNWRQILPSADDPCTQVVLNEAGIAQALETAPRLPVKDENNQAVCLEVRQAKLWLKSRAEDKAAWTEIEIPAATIQGRPRCVRFNRTFLVKALRWGLNEIELRDPNTPLVFRNGGRKLVVAVIGDASQPQAASSATSPPKSPAAAPSEPTSRQETTAAPSPSGAQSETATEPERNRMANTPTPTRPQPVNGEHEASPSAIRAALDQVETIRTALRDLLVQINDTANLLKAAEKEKRAGEREVESVRSTLRSLQRVQL
jgi:DNA polymerase III sliding clamp (beta) subunit (PCNA family)